MDGMGKALFRRGGFVGSLGLSLDETTGIISGRPAWTLKGVELIQVLGKTRCEKLKCTLDCFCFFVFALYFEMSSFFW